MMNIHQKPQDSAPERADAVYNDPRLRGVPRRQIGANYLVGALIALAIGGAAGIYMIAQGGEGGGEMMNQAAVDEVISWLNSMHMIGITRGFDYTGLDETDLIAETSIDDEANVFGIDIGVAVAAGNWQLTYTAPDAASCNYILQRIDEHQGLVAANPVACTAAGVLTATVE